MYMNVSDYYYDLPPERIAQHPMDPRDASRLMVLNRKTKELSHHTFRELPDFLTPGDVLVLNDTRVRPARLLGHREDTGGAVELLLLNRLEKDLWETLARPGKSARPGIRFLFGDGALTATIVAVKPDGNRLVRFSYEGVFETLLDRLGEMPLPPYIHEHLEQKERYQTVYSQEEGSAAAPTAGLHFTPALLQRLRDQGVLVVFLTLHVGLGTFRPVKALHIEEHKMHSEWYRLDAEAAKVIETARLEGRRIISVGTTTTRTLETIIRDHDRITAASGWTDIFIHPGVPFRVVDALLTNFHLPESTLIMLVAAFYGYEPTLEAYRTAVQEGYRFFSFGDAMLIHTPKPDGTDALLTRDPMNQ
ncbi:S-adenosylmethionine:tRNA ribosyltransferase-isomerase [Clostridiaceae bacterium JG1575]|nr:S-adenosylmethionine:tRNA ribosyltransferase-isomerase [Clostridiaceae bacterium JG1575]